MMKTLLSLLILCTFLFSCGYKIEKPGPLVKKPSPSSDGRNTFYCEINGVPYYQKFTGGYSSSPTIDGAYTFENSHHNLDLKLKYFDKEQSENISFFISESDIPKFIQFQSKFGSHALYWKKNSDCDYTLSISKYSSFNGWIKFSRFDPKKSIFSGTFEFKTWLRDSENGNCDTVKITNGIFDVRI